MTAPDTDGAIRRASPVLYGRLHRELRALLDVASLPEPYVLVAHSFGGYVSRAFADLYRGEVVGMVLVDSIHPAEWENPTLDQMKMVHVGLRYARIAAWLARLGVVRFCLARVAKGSSGLGLAAASAFDLPLVVLSGDHHPTPYADWQRHLAQLSSRGVQLLAGDCGHWIHLDRPELITEAIRQVVAATRSYLHAKSFAASGSVSE